MTWSITARDPTTGAFGVAVATKFFGIGAICPFAASGIGAVATQAFVNPTFGPRGLRLLAERLSAEEVLRRLIESDEGRAQRQLHLVDSQGRVAAWTGSECIDWNGHRMGEGFSVAGNMLAGEAAIPGLYIKIARKLQEQFGLSDEAVAYWVIHDSADEEHSDVGFRLLDQFAKTEDDRRLVLKTVQQMLDVQHLMYDDIYKHTLAIGEKTAAA